MVSRTGLMLAAAWALCAAPAGAAPSQAAPQKAQKHCVMSFASGRQIKADVVDTPASREKGLMFYRELPKDYGMLFVFHMEMAMTFWMKNTWVSLDIVFIDRDKRITRVHERVRPSAEDTADADVARVGGPAQYVLELPAGAARRFKLKPGQRAAFDVVVPER